MPTGCLVPGWEGYVHSVNGCWTKALWVTDDGTKDESQSDVFSFWSVGNVYSVYTGKTYVVVWPPEGSFVPITCDTFWSRNTCMIKGDYCVGNLLQLCMLF